MGRYLTHCGRSVVSGLWLYCPFCGESIGEQSASKVAERSAIEPQRSEHFSVSKVVLAPVASLKVSQLRKEIKASGSDYTARSRIDLELQVVYLRDQGLMKRDLANLGDMLETTLVDF